MVMFLTFLQSPEKQIEVAELSMNPITLLLQVVKLSETLSEVKMDSMTELQRYEIYSELEDKLLFQSKQVAGK